MSLLTADNSAALEDKLIRARQKYNKERDAVISAIASRRGAIKETVADLNTEDDALAKVEESARQG